MLKIGLTGNIGSGKTTVAKLFESLCVPVYFTDDHIRKLNNKPEIVWQIINEFGPEAYDSNYKMNSKYISDIIFNDRDKLRKITDIVYPYLLEDFNSWCETQSIHFKYVILESAILFEEYDIKMFDKIIFVNAPLQMRIDRVIRRNGVTKKDVLEREKNQQTPKTKIKKSDFIINNDGTQELLEQVIKIDEIIRKQI